MRLRAALRRELLQAAKGAMPLEACGLVGGLGDELLRFVSCRNAAESARRYAISPEDVLSALREFERQGIELRAIFHSHPAGDARPSATDIREAMYPGVAHLIVGRPPDLELRAFWIEAGLACEEHLDITDGRHVME